jgi:hypothetical protein
MSRQGEPCAKVLQTKFRHKQVRFAELALVALQRVVMAKKYSNGEWHA